MGEMNKVGQMKCEKNLILGVKEKKPTMNVVLVTSPTSHFV